MRSSAPTWASDEGAPSQSTSVRLGLRDNAAQFTLLVLVNALVGATAGSERSVLPLLARDELGLASNTAALGFLIAFGLSKSVANLIAGAVAGSLGRRRVLLLGWLAALPVPALLYWAASWRWIVLANLLLGLNQGLAWSATVIMKIDLAGPRRRGLAMGLNEFAGYLAVAGAALAGGYLAGRVGSRAALAVVTGGAALLGLALTLAFVRDTSEHARVEEASSARGSGPEGPIAVPRQALAWVNQAGLVNNLNDGLAWGLLPLFFAAGGLGPSAIGWLAGLYPLVWGCAQLGTGPLSDRVGRRPLIVGGMLVQALALALFPFARTFAPWAAAAALLGLGTAAVYPTLIAQVSDLVTPGARARAVGRYRLWRDLGYVAGAIVAGLVADAAGYGAAILATAALTALSGLGAWYGLPAGHSQTPSPPHHLTQGARA
jgi:MFS family permease